MDLVERNPEVQLVACLDPIVGIDDRDDVLVLGRHVELLLCAEVLDDVGPALDGGDVRAGGPELEMVGSEADDDFVADGWADRLAEVTRDRDLEACGLEGRALARSGDGRFDEVHRRAADEAGNEPVDRMVVELLRWADLLEDALTHDRDSGAHRHRLDLVVGDVYERGPHPLVEAGDLGSGLNAQLRVEVRQRLVHEEHGGLADDRPTERDALSLAAGELLRLAIEVSPNVENVCRFVDAALDLLLGDLAQLQPEREVVADGHVRV